MLNSALFYVAFAIFSLVSDTSARALSPPAGGRLPWSYRINRLNKRATVAYPQADPFYTPPSNWLRAQNGAVLRSRTIQYAIGGNTPQPQVNGWQLLYRTNGVQGPDTTVATILQPATSTKNVLVSYQFAEDADNQECSPSYNLQYGSNNNDSIVYDESLIMQQLLAQGWTLVIPDYEGTYSAFGAGRNAGMGVLDGIKAALSFRTIGLTTAGTKLFAYGYSGGAIATGWTMALQSTYAPSLNFAAAVHGGTPANLSGTLVHLDGTADAGFGFAGVAGLGSVYPSIQGFIDQYATAAGKAAINFCRANCPTAVLSMFANQYFASATYQPFGVNVVNQPAVKVVLDTLILGKNATETPVPPMLIFHSIADEVIPYNDALLMAQNYCAHGIKSLLFRTDTTGLTHAEMELAGGPAAITFIQGIIAGTPPTSGCSFVNVTGTIVPINNPAPLPGSAIPIKRSLPTGAASLVKRASKPLLRRTSFKSS